MRDQTRWSERLRRARFGAAAATLVVLAAAIVGCSSSSNPNSSTSSSPSASTAPTPAGSSSRTSYPAGKEQLCQARDQLKTSITALTNPSLLTGGTTAIKAAVDQVQNDLNAVSAAAKQNYQPQVNALQSSLQQLQTAVAALGNGNATQNLQTVGTDIAAVGTTATDLFTQLQATCGS